MLFLKAVVHQHCIVVTKDTEVKEWRLDDHWMVMFVRRDVAPVKSRTLRALKTVVRKISLPIVFMVD